MSRASTLSVALVATVATLLLLPPSALSHAEPATSGERPADIDSRESATIEFLNQRIAQDPLDFISKNRLAALYLRRLSRDGNHDNLDRARVLAEASLHDFPAHFNRGGLSLLARIEHASHNFTSAAKLARQLVELTPEDVVPLLILGDALLESGDYDGAADAYQDARKLGDRSPGAVVSLETRLGRMAWLHNRTAEASEHLGNALDAAAALPPGNNEQVAWCRWQIGMMAFAQGDLAAAAEAQEAALAVSRDYWRSIAALAQVRAAQQEFDSAISLYEKAVELNPHIAFVSALGDLYALAKQAEQAERLYSRVERLAFGLEPSEEDNSASPKHTHAPGVPDGIPHDAQWPHIDGRELALFYANHNIKPRLALHLAEREYEHRKDVYTADALAWAAFKAGDVGRASRLAAAALRLGTPDPQLHFHAAVIAHARGEILLAKERLARALSLNANFDPLQAPIGRRLIAELENRADISGGNTLSSRVRAEAGEKKIDHSLR